MFVETKREGEVQGEVQVNPFTLDSLIAWLETQTPAEHYDYCDPLNCLLCQYFKAMGFHDVSVSTNRLSHQFGQIKFPRSFQDPIAHKYANRNTWTFGAALNRARREADARS